MAETSRFEGSSDWQGIDSFGESAGYNPRLSLLEECLAMVGFASANGLPLPQEALDIIDRAQEAASSRTSAGDEPTLSEIGNAHGQLARVVAPANPSTILLLTKERSSRRPRWGRYLGATTYARALCALAVIVFIGFLVALGFSLKYPSSSTLQLILTAVASLVGGIFYVLFTANKQLRAGTFDRRQEGSSTALVVLGVLSGVALAYVVVQPNAGPNENSSTTVILTRPLLGLLGGFAVEAVYRILQRLVSTLEALVGGSGDELVQAQRREAIARAALQTSETRIQLAARLAELRRTLSNLSDKEREMIQQEIDRLLQASPQA